MYTSLDVDMNEMTSKMYSMSHFDDVITTNSNVIITEGFLTS